MARDYSKILSNYQFKVSKDKDATHAVAFSTDNDPVAAITINRGDRQNNEEQSWMSLIHRPHEQTTALPNEGQTPGQQRWSGGNMDPKQDMGDVDYVSWFGSTEKGNPHLLRGLISIASHEHGGGPIHADEALTNDSAKLARHLNRTMGLKGHPNNPDIDPVIPDMTNNSVSRMNTGVVASMSNSRDVPSDDVARLTNFTFSRPPRKRNPAPTEPQLPGMDG